MRTVDLNKPLLAESPLSSKAPSVFKNPYLYRAIAAASFGVPMEVVFILGLIPLPLSLSNAAAISVISFALMNFSGWEYFRGFFYSLKNLQKNPIFSMDTLVTLSCYGAWIYAMVTVFDDAYSEEQVHMGCYLADPLVVLAALNVSSLMKSQSQKKINMAKSEVMDELTVRQPSVVITDKGVELQLSDVEIGQLFVVEPNCFIGVDGLLLSPSAVIDEMTLTNGEFNDICKTRNEIIHAGTLNRSQDTIVIQAISKGGQSEFNYLARAFEKPENERIFYLDQLMKRITKVFVPGSLLLSIASFLIWTFVSGNTEMGIHAMMNVLFAACPCSLALAVPLAMEIGRYAAAIRYNIFICKDSALASTPRVNTIVFDKTGTLTEPEIIDVISLSPEYMGELTTEKKEKKRQKEREILKRAMELEHNSSHPLAKKIISYGYRILGHQTFEAIEGTTHHQGIEKNIDNKTFMIGSAALLAEHNIEAPGVGHEEAVFLVEDNQVIGKITFRHTTRPEAREVVQALQRQGYHCIILSGGSAASVSDIASELNITEYYADRSALQKLEVINSLPLGRCVLYVGDGGNDLRSAEKCAVSVSAGHHSLLSVGASVTIAGDLRDLLIFIEIAKLTIQNVKQNLAWSIFYNVCMILLASILFPLQEVSYSHAISGIAMAVSSLIVVFNAGRLLTLIANLDPRNTNQRQQQFMFSTRRAAIATELHIFHIENVPCGNCASSLRSLLQHDVIKAEVFDPVDNRSEVRIRHSQNEVDLRAHLQRKLKGSKYHLACERFQIMLN